MSSAQSSSSSAQLTAQALHNELPAQLSSMSNKIQSFDILIAHNFK
jgi:hypothetical protein